ncbi:unnamed protein product [Sphacelaria rigidula]
MLGMPKESSADVLGVFDAELLLLSQLSSPNVVKIFGAAVSPVQLIIVSEFVEGGTLRDQLENVRRGPDFWIHNRKSIAQDVAAGMRSVYAHGMQHRRLTSTSVLLTHSWRAKISGLGFLMTKEMVARAHQQDEDEEKEDAKTAYQALWVSREVLGGAGFAESSDVYSFGIVLWEIVQGDGSLPFTGLSPTEVASAKYHGQGPVIPKGCPRDLESLMTRCWSTTPEQRPSFEHICDELDPAPAERILL